MSSVSLLLDASVLNPADTVIVPNRTTVNLRPGSGMAMTKQVGDEDVVLSSTVTPTQPGVIGGHVIYTTPGGLLFPVAQSQRVTYPFNFIELTYGTPVAALGPGNGDVTILSSGTYKVLVRMGYSWPLTRFGYLILDRFGVGQILATVIYSQTTANQLAVAEMSSTFNLVAGDILKVTVDGFQVPGKAIYLTFDSSDTRWDITRIY